MIKTYRLKLPDTSIAKTLPLATVIGISLQNIICSDTSSAVLENLDLISTKHLSFVSKSFYASINYQTPDLKTRCIFKDILDPQNCYPEHWRSIEGVTEQ